jgi:hypothetical protein
MLQWAHSSSSWQTAHIAGKLFAGPFRDEPLQQSMEPELGIVTRGVKVRK